MKVFASCLLFIGRLSVHIMAGGWYIFTRNIASRVSGMHCRRRKQINNKHSLNT